MSSTFQNFYLPPFLPTVRKKISVIIENVFTSAHCAELGAFALSDCNFVDKKKLCHGIIFCTIIAHRVLLLSRHG